MRAEKGITLVALVITIIVLLILAIVSVSLVMNNGIINHANNAVTKYNAAQYIEQTHLNTTEATMNSYASQIK